MNHHPLTDRQIEHYRRQGYVVVEGVVSADLLAEIGDVIERITRRAISTGETAGVLEWEPRAPGGPLVARRIYNPFEQHEVFRRLATSAELLDRVESLIGPDINLHHSKLNMKPPRVGSVVEWHQDIAYFPHTNDDLVSTLVYLDDATEQNGCLQVLPRRHDRYFCHERPDGTFAGMITEDLAAAGGGRPQPLAAAGGSAIFMHCRLPHSSLPNRSERPRRTLIFEYRAADALPIYYSDRAADTERRARHLRGEPARYARLGGPPPYIPRLAGTQSLYELQGETKAAARSRSQHLPGLEDR